MLYIYLDSYIISQKEYFTTINSSNRECVSHIWDIEFVTRNCGKHDT